MLAHRVNGVSFVARVVGDAELGDSLGVAAL